MKALLLAAGFGTRLRPLTNHTPKCMVEIGGSPLLDMWIESLAAAGVERFLVNTHHLSDVVRRHLESHPLRHRITVVHEETLLGTGGTLRANHAFCNEGTTLVAHADNVCVCDWKAFFKAHARRPAGTEMTMMTFKTPSPQSCGIVELDDRGVVMAFHEKQAEPPGDTANAAVYLFEPSVMERLVSASPPIDDVSTGLLPQMLGRMNTWFNNGLLIDIGTPETLERARSLCSHLPPAVEDASKAGCSPNFWKKTRTFFRQPGKSLRKLFLKGPEEAVRREMLAAMGAMETEFFEVTNSQRIGHMGGEVDVWLKERSLNDKHGRKVLVMSSDACANPHLFTYLSEKFDGTISSAVWKTLVDWLPEVSARHAIRHDYYVAIGRAAASYGVHARWAGERPLFVLHEADRMLVRETCEAWGMKKDGWHVCFHNREAGYAPDDDDHHSYRNADIETCLPAMREVVARGGIALRMGDPTMKRLAEEEGIIDYAHSPLRSPRLDVALTGSARCFAGSSSGLFIIASMFGVPVLAANMAPITIHAMTQWDISMPKLYFSEKENRLLQFDEVFSSLASAYRFNHEFVGDGLRLVDNDAEDILEALKQLLGGPAISSDPADELLQRRYRSLFCPNHYGYGSAATISRSFLRKHQGLFSHVDPK